jgi:3-hydroxyacyl-CoA dehydrogenase
MTAAAANRQPISKANSIRDPQTCPVIVPNAVFKGRILESDGNLMEHRRIGIVGCGIIGASWALTFARAGYQVQVWQRSGTSVLDRIRRLAENVEETGSGLTEDNLKRISIHEDMAHALNGVCYVQESIAENLEWKSQVLAEIERHAGSEVLIGSSTSAILPSRLSRELAHPHRFLVVHPLTPPHLLPLAEICPAPETTPEIIQAAVALLTSAGQSPVVLNREVEGFVANRLLGAVLNELFALIGEGVIDPADADTIFTEGFGLRWVIIGPLAAMDLNAPAGVRDYLTRYGDIVARVAESRGARASLTPNVIDRIATALAASSSLSPTLRAARRDQAIARVKDLRPFQR